MSWYNRNLFGSNDADTITGNNFSNKIFGFGGNDLIFAKGGNDIVYGGSGHDKIFGGSGHDRLYGESGNDWLDGGTGNDILYGGSGNDVLIGGDGTDYLFGSWGNDYLYGGNHNDRLYGGSGNDFLSGDAGNDALYGGSGNDFILGGDGHDYLSGSSGHDTLLGGAGNDYLNGGSGNDFLDGNSGSDEVRGGYGNDYLNFDVAENDGAYNFYDGERGIDTLSLELTAEQFADPEIATELLAFIAHMNQHRRSNGEVKGPVFYFASLNLGADDFEVLRVFVDGVERDPADAGSADTLEAADDSFSVTENGSVSDDVTANDTIDAGTTVTLISNVSQGVLTLNSDGTFSFDAGTDFDGLAVGETADVSFVYEISNGSETQQATATITVTGENDAPTVTAAISQTGSEDAAAFSVDLLQGASDVDGDVLSVENLILVSGDASGVTISGNSIDVDPSAYADLNDGETEVIIYSYNVSDGNDGFVAQTATITITGVGVANTPPMVSGPVVQTINEDDLPTNVDLLAGADDADGDALNIANLVLVSGDASGVSVNGNSLDVDTSAYQYLSPGQTIAIEYSYDIIDGNGGMVSQTVTLTIEGENDAPVVSSAVSASASEDDAQFSVILLNDVFDAEGDALTILNFALVSGDDSGVTFAANRLDVDPSAYDSLAAGETEVIEYSFDISDGLDSVSQTAVLTITGQNDAPVALAVSGAANENGPSVTVMADFTDIDASDMPYIHR